MLKYRQRLIAGDPVSDDEFDGVYQDDVRAASTVHWTPVAVARRAAELLTTIGGATRILDVGAGPGKFCIVGALTTTAEFTGIERRRGLVAAAETATHRFGAGRAKVLQGDFLELDCTHFDGFYFFNPFGAEVMGAPLSRDEVAEFSFRQFRIHVAATIARLIGAQAGTAVATYYGFGGRMPHHYRRVVSERVGDGELAMWVRSPHAIG